MVIKSLCSPSFVLTDIADCIYKRSWLPTAPPSGKPSRPVSETTMNGTVARSRPVLSAEDDAKLIFGTVFSLRNMVRKLGGDDDT
jgi:trafficking protein particle complex subunit 1